MHKKKNKFTIIYIITIILLLFIMIYTINNKKNSYINNIIKDIVYLPTRLITHSNGEDIIGTNINDELKKENEELKKLLSIQNTLSEFKVINATVIERNTTYWFNTITINKGKKDGIEPNMAVVTSDGLIGKVEHISYLSATVKLITSNDKNNKISVRINTEDKSYNSILTTNEKGKMIISGLDNESKIKVGDKVVTSGLSEIFPSGIIIGQVSKIENDEYGVSKKIYVESKTQIDNVRFVSILSRKIEHE